VSLVFVSMVNALLGVWRPLRSSFNNEGDA
jgi:hypothetical protein